MEFKRFGDYRSDGHKWITIFDTPFYPDALSGAVAKYGPVLDAFARLADSASSSNHLLRRIQREPKEIRIQLLRVFRKYVSPDTSVEMLKMVRKTDTVIEQFGDRFRDLLEVRSNLAQRPAPDEALIAVLAEYGTRGRKGYELTSAFFLWFETELGQLGWRIDGPLGAGQDINLQAVLTDYPTKTPVDFVITDPNAEPRVIGFARYDSDRGGAQEDDRVGGNERRLREILRYAEEWELDVRVVFLNDGPGLLLGSMWADYAAIEDGGEGAALVTTLAMAQAGRFSIDWIEHGSE